MVRSFRPNLVVSFVLRHLAIEAGLLLLFIELTEAILYRDIVEGLRTCGCTSTTHFEWQRQLRFELDTVLDDVAIRQVSTGHKTQCLAAC